MEERADRQRGGGGGGGRGMVGSVTMWVVQLPCGWFSYHVGGSVTMWVGGRVGGWEWAYLR